MTKTAIVILNWNGIEFLKKFLPPLIKNSNIAGAKIIIADNASNDESVPFLKEKYPQIQLIELGKNFGFAEGYNRALKTIEADYFLLLNSDIEVTPNWLDPLVSFMDNHHEFAACAPVLLDYYHKNNYEYAGAAGGYIDKYGYTFCRGRIFGNVEQADSIPSQPMEVFWTTGACMMVRRDLFMAQEGFDSRFFAHMEEVDLCWRLKNKGHKLAIIPQSKVYHVGGGTLPKNNPFKTYLNFRNNLYLLYKNLPDKELKRTLRIRKNLDRLSAIMFLLTFKLKDFVAVFKAHKTFRSTQHVYENIRKEKTNSGNALHPEIYRKSLVYDYFIIRNKTFDKLRDNFPDEMAKRIA